MVLGKGYSKMVSREHDLNKGKPMTFGSIFLRVNEGVISL